MEQKNNRDDPLFRALEERFKNLYQFRDLYFEKNPIENALNLQNDVKRELVNLVSYFENVADKALALDRAYYYYLLGSSYNVESSYNPKVEELLSKAVKLDPKLTDAWNQLGEYYWKKGDSNEAKNCFCNALSMEKNKVSLRCLSMIVRQEGGKTNEEKLRNIELGVKYAKEALELDDKDGLSWSIMGNAYMSSYFYLQPSSDSLANAMSSYRRAEQDVIANNTPDLHYNRAVAFKFMEDYKEALIAYEKAHKLDPMWKQTIEENALLLRYLHNTQDLINQKGKMKAKKLQTLIKKMDRKYLGIHDKGEKESDKLTYIPFSKLKCGANNGCIILGAVVCSVYNENNVPFTFCMVDEESTCIAVTVYNLAEGQGFIIGDMIAIPVPVMKNVNFTHNDKSYAFQSIRVNSPIILVANGKQMTREKLAISEMSTFKLL